MDSAAIGSSSMKLDSKRAPYAAGPLRQASRLHIRVTPVRCLADFPEPRIQGVSGRRHFCEALRTVAGEWKPR
jgi:hypothetical protein